MHKEKKHARAIASKSLAKAKEEYHDRIAKVPPPKTHTLSTSSRLPRTPGTPGVRRGE